VDVDVKVVWNEECKGLKLAFPYAGKGEFIGQTAFGTQTYKLDMEQCAQKFCGIDDGENVLSIYANYLGGCSVEKGVLYVTLFNGSVYCAHPVGDLPIVDDKRCNDFLEKGRHSFSFRFALDKRTSLEKNAIEFTQKPYVVNAYPHGKGKMERESVVTLSNTNVVITSLRKVGADSWAIRLFNNLANATQCTCRLFDKELALSFGKYEVKTLYYQNGVLEEDERMIRLD
jgi:alpha-mannosidase